MNENEERRKEILSELAARFKDSAQNLRDVARRIDAASQADTEMRRRMNAAGERLRDCVENAPDTIPFTYLEYVEFASAEEFKKFRSMSIIDENEIRSVDLDDLATRLQSA